FIDAPLTSSPCDMCVRAVCPGVLHCEDLAVAYMLKLNEECKKSGRRKKRPLNPQNQRLWDVAFGLDPRFSGLEPSFSSNKIALVARAKALAKRLQRLEPAVGLKETSVPHTLAAMASAFHDYQRASQLYRNFEAGGQYRKQLVTFFLKQGWLAQ